MSLPKLDKPIFEMKVPSQDRYVKFRPFLVREEKILLIAQQSGNDKDIITAIKQVLANCIVDIDFKIDSLTTFDLEYMFLKLRAKSVNNVVEVSYRDLEDNKIYDFEVDLDQIEITMPESVSNKIQITDKIGMIMKYPSVTIIDEAPEGATSLEMVEYLVASCIDKVYDEDSVYPIVEQSKKDVQEFIDNLDVETYERVRNFFNEMPRLHYRIDYKNSLGNERFIELTSLRDFFTWG